ncbi:MAG: prenyltransferase/squalene oxidase repeat-containing protein [Planctomycetota bacterium]|jgi:hypothetical protein
MSADLRKWIPIMTFLCGSVPAGGAPAPKPAREPRSRRWLVRYVNQPIKRTARNRRYLEAIRQALARDPSCGLDVEWLKSGSGREGRRQTNALGRLAFCYRTKGLKGRRDPGTLSLIRRGLLGASAHVNAKGMLEWPGERGYWYEAHEQGWRLEPLLMAMLWAGDDLPEADRRRIEGALKRSADWLLAHPYRQNNNRGAVWCAVAALCGLYFDRPDWLAAADRLADRVMPAVVQPDGEVGERTRQYGGGGPCSNYSFTSISYVYLYRLLSGRTDMDPQLARAARWFSACDTLSGHSIVPGASVRTAYDVPPQLHDVLPLLERYARHEPFLAAVAAGYLRNGRASFRGHIISPEIWAMFEAGPPAPKGPAPDWFVNFTGLYERPEVHYALVARRYQTGVTFRGRTRRGYEFRLRGMQTFAWGDEHPILLPHRPLRGSPLASTITAGKIRTAEKNASRVSAGWEVLAATGPKLAKWRCELATLTDRRGRLWTIHACTPVSVVAVSGGVDGPITARWVVNEAGKAAPELDSSRRIVSVSGLTARVYCLTGRASMKAAAGRIDRHVLKIVTPSGPAATAFSDSSFRFGGLDEAGLTLTFSDASGSYALSLKNVIDANGHLNRRTPFRLTRRP